MIDLCIGTTPIYWLKQRLFIDLYVKPATASATSYGQAKQQRWNMLDEVRRILTYNPTGSKDIDFIELGGTIDADELQPRPDVLHTRIGIICFGWRTGSA